jgi:peptide/nickel transport system permease protein
MRSIRTICGRAASRFGSFGRVLGAKNITIYIIALAIILTLNFLLPRLMPGDPLMAIYGDEALVQMSPQLQSDLVQRFALDQSLWNQFGAYLKGLFTGDLGYSYYYNASVFNVILGRLPWTLLLVGLSLILSTIIGIFLGIESGWRRGSRLDRGMLAGMMSLNGFPDFFIGTVLLLVFGVTLGLLPLSGAVTPYSGFSGGALLLDVLKHLVLPLTALTLAHVAAAYLLTRNTMITVLKEPFMLTARAKGLSPRALKYRHAGRNSMLPVLTMTGIWVGILITGTLFIEIIFSYPGLGHLMYEALLFRDYVVIQGVLLLIATVVLAINLLIDLSYTKIDPRVSYAH